MKILKITNLDDGKTEFLNLDRVLSIKPYGEKAKILMGAGLFWWAERETMEILTLPENFDEIVYPEPLNNGGSEHE